MFINSIFKGRIKNIHFIGIGGIGMSGIAQVLISHGFKVSGSDLKESDETLNLKKLSAQIFIDHKEENIKNVDVVVFSSAISEQNPEIIAAQKKHIPIIPRALMLAELMRLRVGIAVAGAHGKTTTTSIIGTLMRDFGLDPTIIIGGVINKFLSNALVGQGQYLVAEADESDGTFLHLFPTIAVITNIDKEHLDYYKKGLEEICENFFKFTANLPFYGLLVACIDDIEVKKMLPKVNRRVKTYGFSKEADYRASNIKTEGLKTTFDLFVNNKFIYNFTINMAGLHNVLNSLASIAVLEELGIKAESLKPGLEAFCGVKRRFSLIGRINDISLIDDYAHHPSEIKAVISAAKRSFPASQIKILFQPHRFTRTQSLFQEFTECFSEADAVVITDIYPAQEKPILNINSQVLVENINYKINDLAFFASSIEEGIEKLVNLAYKNDVLFIMGAGNITKAGPKAVESLYKKFSEL